MSRGDWGPGYSFNIPGGTRRNGVWGGLAVLSLRGGCHGGRVGLAAISGIGGLHVVIGLPITSLRGGCGGTVWPAVLSTRRWSRRRNGTCGVLPTRWWRRCDGTCGVVPTRRLRRRSWACDVIDARRSRRWGRACSIIRAQRRSRRWWGRACDVVPTRRWRWCDGARGVVPTRRSCWWSWACDNIVMRCRRAVRVEHSRVTRRWCLGRGWCLRVSRQ
jgi:hypothetical protein